MNDNFIREFYQDQDIFITGGTGLIGKCIIEKILRTYSDVNKIYMLLREKPGSSFYKRFEEFKNYRIFDRIRKENPNALKKLTAIKGDISEINLGLSENDLKLLENVSIIFHVAATVRFDEPLQRAILQNVRGTQEALKIAQNLNKIKIFLHVSTGYSNPYNYTVKEEIYPALADWKTFVHAATKFDMNMLDALTQKLIHKFPNTYTFSKHLAENVVDSYKNRVPVAIVRPTIVTSAFDEPHPGWYDTFTGAFGLIAFAGTGLGRVLHCNPDICFDIIPLDVVTILSIAIAWKETVLPKLGPDDKVRVYNVAGSNHRPLTAGTLFGTFLDCLENNPFIKCIWYPRLTLTANKYYFMLNFYLFHILPALLLDTLIKLSGNKMFLMHIQRKYLAALNVLNFFMVNQYKFIIDNGNTVFMDIKDTKDYNFDRMLESSTFHHFEISLYGLKAFLLNEPREASNGQKIKFKIFKYLHYSIHFYFYYWIIKTISNYILTKW